MSSDEYSDREQSQIKHFALGLYLNVAARILGQSRDIAYVDCCAGPWKSETPDYRDTSFGVALRALRDARVFLRSKGKNPKFRMLLIEDDPGAFAKLKAFAGQTSVPETTIRAEKWDFTEHLDEIVEFARQPPAFPFVFIDPTGWKLAQLNVIKPILQLNPGEVLINLMSSFITRFVNDAHQDFTNLLGAKFAELRDLHGEEQEDEVVRRYCEAIRQVGGFRYVCALPVMKADRDSFQFHLIYATRHLKGVEKFKEVERRAARQTEVIRAEKQQKKREKRSRNLDLFTPEIRYQETRYQRLKGKNKGLAGSAVMNLIKTRDSLSYDECWAEAMQFAAVYESDLRGWLAAAESQNLVRIAGRKTSAEVLKIRANHTISLVR
jgi:three-Cys-motif partner protein